MSEIKWRRRRQASQEQVDLYRVLVNAGKPLTVDEIADLMPETYRTPAYAARRKYLTEVKYPHDSLVFTPMKQFTAEMWHNALTWWVGGIINTARIKRRVIVTTPDGSSTVGKRRAQLLYEANHDNAPKS